MRPQDLDPEELLMTLSDVLTDVAAGRLEGHRCPICQGADLVCAEDHGEVRVQCAHCRLDFVGYVNG